jgi:hypothetical protein
MEHLKKARHSNTLVKCVPPTNYVLLLDTGHMARLDIAGSVNHVRELQSIIPIQFNNYSTSFRFMSCYSMPSNGTNPPTLELFC